jgi:hypothetical protein
MKRTIAFGAGPPARKNSGSGRASLPIAGSTTICRSMVRPCRLSRFSNTVSEPQ